MIHCFGKRVTISRYVTVTIRQRQQGKVDMGETEMKKFDDRTYTITNMDVVKPLPVEYPYCALCLNFSWELVERVWWKDIGGKPISCYNRYIPVGLCMCLGKPVSAFATCGHWQDDA
jgi:hypothetical protein